jgi:hypothetical protein
MLAALVLAACTPSPTPTPSPSPAQTPSQAPSAAPSVSPVGGVCQDFSHVYHSYRLKVLAQCVHVSGIVEIVRLEADGDRHILVHLDPGQVDPNGGGYINQANTTYQHGDLVTEPVCTNLPVTQADAIASCAGYRNPTFVPVVGQHVEVSGPWVLDLDHYSWAECHPATYDLLAALADPLTGGD